MASLDLHEKANFTRLSRLFVDKGTEALRNTFDGIHSPANLPAVLSANKTSLLKLKPRVINDSQWDLLFPPSGHPPDSKTFDVTLLTVLFRNICGLPTTGWGAMPVDADRSMQANIVRIKLRRNEVYAHVTSTRVDNATFEVLWKKISQSLVDLNIPQKDIDEMKTCALGPEEDVYVGILKDWKLHEEESLKVLESVESSLCRLTEIAEESRDGIKQLCQSDTDSESHRGKEKDEDLLRKLAKHNFKSKIRSKVKYFLPGTREWLLKKVDQWFNEKEQESRILLLTAGPGFGKTVFSAKVCEDFKKKEKLGACHFCDFGDSNLSNPMVMLQSLARQMCENVVVFKKKLIDQLKQPHEIRNLRDAFRIYLQNPLDELELSEPILIVIDGLDESAADNKNEIVNLIANYFPDLPEFIKVLVTSRPEISVAKLTGPSQINIENSNADNNSDLEIYLQSRLPTIADQKDRGANFTKLNDRSFVRIGRRREEVLQKLVKACEGSFLYAFFVQSELERRNDLHQLTSEEIAQFLPKGLDSIYQAYFRRLEEELKAIMDGNFDVLRVLEMLVASRGPLPLTFISRALGLTPNCRETKNIINRVNVAVSCLLYVSDDHVTVFHKSVFDWLLAKGCKDHEYTVKVIDGDRSLWVMCEQTFEEIKETICPGHDLNLTNNLKYALEHGLGHLTSCEMKESYTWLVDVVIVYLLLTTHEISGQELLRLWENVLPAGTGITGELRARISWHIVELEVILNECETYKDMCYLTSVLAHSPKGYFSENEKHIAKNLLSKFPRLVYDDYNHRVEVAPLAVYKNPNLKRLSAVGLSIDKSLAAVGVKSGTVILVDLTSLVELWECHTDRERIPCCTFAPDDSFVLFGKLETALSIAERKEVPFFHNNKETFVSCGFSPNGKRLVTGHGSSTIKLWDIAKQSLLSSFCTDGPVFSCSFSNRGLFIIANEKYERRHDGEDSFCIWNAVTWQRCDDRNKTGKALFGKLCKRCFPATFELPASKRSNVESCRMLRPGESWSTGIFDGVKCNFVLEEQSLRVVENTHFTMLACWDINFCESKRYMSKYFRYRTLIAIEDGLWLYADAEKLIVFRTIQEKSSGMPYPALVYSTSFSPDGSRLATCTSDGFVNVWNVNKNQVDQRFKCCQEESPSACWWSEKFLLVFHVLDGIPILSKYPMDTNLKLLPSQRDMCHFPPEFVHLSTVIDFSEGFLVFECMQTNTVSVLDVKGISGFQMVTLPQIEPNMKITVSPRCSFIFGSSRSTFYIWKRSEVEAPVYDVYFRGQVSHYGARCCCFSSDCRLAVVDVEDGPEHFQIIFLDTGKYKIVRFNCSNLFFFNKMFCFSGVLISWVNAKEIRIFDRESGARIVKSFQRHLRRNFATQMKLSPNDTTLAIPMMNGDMEFMRLSITHNPLLPNLKAEASIKWKNKKKRTKLGKLPSTFILKRKGKEN